MMDAQITGISQEFSFEDGEVVNFVVLQLDDGSPMRALVSNEDAARLTALFLKMGGAAAERAFASVTAAVTSAETRPEARRPPSSSMSHAAAEEVPVARDYSPLRVSGSVENALEFGGDFSKTQNLAAVGAQLKEAEATLASAVGDTATLDGAALHQIAARLRQGASTSLPQQPWDATPLEAPRPPARLPVRVVADEAGNPVLEGAGLVDPRSILGGDLRGEEDAGQV